MAALEVTDADDVGSDGMRRTYLSMRKDAGKLSATDAEA
jgi:hypothetical protein